MTSLQYIYLYQSFNLLHGRHLGDVQELFLVCALLGLHLVSISACRAHLEIYQDLGIRLHMLDSTFSCVRGKSAMESEGLFEPTIFDEIWWRFWRFCHHLRCWHNSSEILSSVDRTEWQCRFSSAGRNWMAKYSFHGQNWMTGSYFRWMEAECPGVGSWNRNWNVMKSGVFGCLIGSCSQPIDISLEYPSRM